MAKGVQFGHGMVKSNEKSNLNPTFLGLGLIKKLRQKIEEDISVCVLYLVVIVY